MNLKEQTFFFKRLAFLCNAHIPLVEGLRVLREQSTNKKQIRVFDRIVADVEEGQPLSKAFSKFPQVFGQFCVSIVRVGERSGTLSTTLEYLAAELKKKQLLKSKVVSAFIYPALITCATLGITIFLLLFLFPKIMPIFKSLRASVPLSTRVVMGASNFLVHDGLYVGAGLALVVVGSIYAMRRSARLRMAFEKVVLRLPLIGQLVQLYNVSNCCRTLGLLLRSGLPLPEAVLITSDATPNLLYKNYITHAQVAVARGERLSVYFAAAPSLFPLMLCHMTAVGERSGTLPETLLYVAEAYDNEVDEFTKNLSTLIEPALMICMGVLVGFIAVSIITPIYAITQNLHA